MPEHAWFDEHLASYCAGGLEGDERRRFEEHAATCDVCAAALKQTGDMDRSLARLFDSARPAPGFESRVIDRFRTTAPSNIRWSAAQRWLGAAAAVILLGLLGAGMHTVMQNTRGSPLDLFVADARRPLKSEDALFHIDPSLSELDTDIDYHLRDSDGYTGGRLFERFPPNSPPSVPGNRGFGGGFGGFMGGLAGAPPVDAASVKGQGGLTPGFGNSPNGRGVTVNGTSPGEKFEPPQATDGAEATPASPSANLNYFGYNQNALPKLTPPNKQASETPTDSSAKVETPKVSDTTVAGGPKVTQGQKENEAVLNAPAADQRKIIRTGELEFEVESFDQAVAEIQKLIAGIKGAFIATINSEKLPNGKVRGSVVIRIPPERLDPFVMDLRGQLTKAGELKNQRIGSLDVTKQYTDLESRLRAARTMEERLLSIIKSGKGEIKDLIAAERELGVWRTKIEEMEGEIRYLGNQVSLSTLTITMAEKQIQAPAVMVVSEKVNLRIEVLDVEKQYQAARDAVADLKGRILRAELKQHAAGQMEAILHVEVAPDVADKLRASLRQLGDVSHLDAEHVQQADSGSGKLADGKIKRQDVQFQITIYNVANIEPRQVIHLQIATHDVPAAYRQLQEATRQTEAQVRSGQINEQDKLNVTAQLDFDVPTPNKEAIDKVIAAIGDDYARQATQAAPNVTATDKKIGYRITLRSVAGIPPREKVTLGIEVKDVDLAASKFAEMVRDAKGAVTASQTTHDPSGRVTAKLLFDVPLSAKDQLVRAFKSMGNVRVQQSARNPQAPDTRLATAHLDVTLSNAIPIVPEDEGLWPQIRTGLAYSFRALSFSLMFIILGVSVVLPWALVIWLGVRIVRRFRRPVTA